MAPMFFILSKNLSEICKFINESKVGNSGAVFCYVKLIERVLLLVKLLINV